MPPRNEQEFEQRRQQIIDGALSAFAEKGFERATNKDIAESAGIGSAGLIYHYFQDKLDLLYQVILERMPLLQLVNSADEWMEFPPEEALPMIGRRFIELVDQWPTMAIGKIVAVESLRNQQVARMVSDIGPGRALRLLAQYLEKQMDAGRLRRTDPHAAARVFIGPIITYLVTREVFDQPEARAISVDTMINTSVSIFLHGMQADRQPNS
jgi:TetR/AcrR family transcriptional repressor of mexJK operon